MAGRTISPISNIATQQDSLTGQSVKCILATRAYICDAVNAPASLAGTPTARCSSATAGVTTWSAPTAATGTWADMGAVLRSKVSMTYDKTYTEVRTGLDGVFRAAYVTAKSCSWAFGLENYDYTVLGQITGTTMRSSATGSGAYQFWIGKEDTIVKQLLLVGVNKIDGKEHHYYCPEALLKFAWGEDGDAIVVNVTADLRSYDFSATGVPAPTKDPATGSSSFYQITIWD